MVERDGTIFRFTPETKMNRHIIGYNWCAIGIENVGGVNGQEDLTSAQLTANVELIRYLHEKYPSIRYVFGHYEQDGLIDSAEEPIEWIVLSIDKSSFSLPLIAKSTC